MSVRNTNCRLGLWLIISLLLMSLAGLGACAKPAPAPTPTPTNSGIVSIRVTDAPPTGVSSIMVTTDNIQIHKADTAEGAWITVVEGEKTFDLVAIQGAEVFLGQKEVDAGHYTQIRLDVTKVIVTLEGKEITAKLPSEKLKVVRSWEVKPGEVTILTLDFDADKFVVITGKDNVQVKPVIKLEVTQGKKPSSPTAPTEAS